MIFDHIKIPLIQKDDQLIYYQNGSIYAMSEAVRHKIVTLKLPVWVKQASLCRPGIRFFRCIPRAACLARGNFLIFALRKRIFVVDLQKRVIKKEFHVRKEFSNPLNITPVTQIKGYLAVFGDYGSNEKRESIYIYGITENLECRILYRFPENTIRHIHNIVPDPENHSLIILTGDTGKDSGIYRLEDDFQTCRMIAAGKQMYRAVQGFLSNHKLIYATDAVMEENRIYEMDLETLDCQSYGSINGSCIYGTKCGNDIFFSTCVEADETMKGRFRKWFTSKLGAGIKNRNVTLLKINGEKDIEEIASFEKDRWPMKLFQYGTVLFPQVYGDAKFLFYLPLGVRKCDLKLKKYDLQE